MSPGQYDRVFYTGIAAAMAITVLIGFAPTYYLRGWVAARSTVTGATTLSLMTHVHGLLFTAWVLLFVVQTGLVASRRTRVHQRLGIAGAVLAAAMVAAGVTTAIAAARRGSSAPGMDALAFLIVPIGDVVLFAIFVSMALSRRRDREAHKRLMLLGYCSILVAAVARLPGMLTYGPLAFFGMTFLFVVAGALYDRVTRGRIHPVYLWGGALIALSVPLRLAVSGTAAWQTVARFLVS